MTHHHNARPVSSKKKKFPWVAVAWITYGLGSALATACLVWMVMR